MQLSFIPTFIKHRLLFVRVELKGTLEHICHSLGHILQLSPTPTFTKCIGLSYFAEKWC